MYTTVHSRQRSTATMCAWILPSTSTRSTAAYVDVCLSDPGHEVDLYVEADIAAMASVWLGDIGFAAALRTKKIRLAEIPALAR
jgi:hypothetical protein